MTGTIKCTCVGRFISSNWRPLYRCPIGIITVRIEGSLIEYDIIHQPPAETSFSILIHIFPKQIQLFYRTDWDRMLFCTVITAVIPRRYSTILENSITIGQACAVCVIPAFKIGICLFRSSFLRRPYRIIQYLTQVDCAIQHIGQQMGAVHYCQLLVRINGTGFHLYGLRIGTAFDRATAQRAARITVCGASRADYLTVKSTIFNGAFICYGIAEGAAGNGAAIYYRTAERPAGNGAAVCYFAPEISLGCVFRIRFYPSFIVNGILHRTSGCYDGSG